MKAGLGLIDRIPREQAGWMGSQFHVRHDPPLRIIVAGQGDEPVALARQALAYGAQVVVLTPDDATADMVRALGVEATKLKVASRRAGLECDDRTAVVLLFHDHDWEETLLMEALDHPCFYIGAMGSSLTHEHRVRMLEEQGASMAQRARVRGPIGLIPAARDPDTLALSVMAEIVAVARSAPKRRSRSESEAATAPARRRAISDCGATTPQLVS